MVILAPAKLNLTLDILGTRMDGYHLMKMVMQAVSLCDRITIEHASGFSLSCDSSVVPMDSSNLAVRAAECFCAHIGVPMDSFCLLLEKNIPSGAGMGGGSADAAGVLAGLNVFLGANLPLSELCGLGERIGADVPFCLTGSTALVEGIGELVTPVPDFPDCHFLIVKPGFSVNTREAFIQFDHGGIHSRPDTNKMLEAVASSDLPRAAHFLGNVFEQTVPFPQLREIKEAMLLGGALGAVMTGSGSAIFGIFDREEAAKTVHRELTESGLWSCICAPFRGGPQILPDKLV